MSKPIFAKRPKAKAKKAAMKVPDADAKRAKPRKVDTMDEAGKAPEASKREAQRAEDWLATAKAQAAHQKQESQAPDSSSRQKTLEEDDIDIESDSMSDSDLRSGRKASSAW